MQPIFHLFTLGVGVGGNANLCVFKYQHVSIPNTKLWHWGSKPTRGPNANGFASQWHIGFRKLLTLILKYWSIITEGGGQQHGRRGGGE